MKRKLHTPEQIVKKLREADAAIASGTTVEQVCRHLMAGGAGVEWYFGYKFAHNDRGKDWVALIKRKTTKYIWDQKEGRQCFQAASPFLTILGGLFLSEVAYYARASIYHGFTTRL